VPPVVVLFGPTALGKTAIAVELAERLHAEIVTADSMQVYAGLPLLTNQPTADQAARVPHHLVGFVEPRNDFSAAEYAGLAHNAIDALLGHGRRVVLEGGSGLYVRAALGGLHFGPAPDPALRAGLEHRLDQEGVSALAAELQRLDPQMAGTVDLANSRRVLRALETIALRRDTDSTGRAYRRPRRGASLAHAAAGHRRARTLRLPGWHDLTRGGDGADQAAHAASGAPTADMDEKAAGRCYNRRRRGFARRRRRQSGGTGGHMTGGLPPTGPPRGRRPSRRSSVIALQVAPHREVTS
jgi:hypothetical protein